MTEFGNLMADAITKANNNTYLKYDKTLVTLLTRLSVVCALRTIAINNS